MRGEEDAGADSVHAEDGEDAEELVVYYVSDYICLVLAS
jgi:hypothetical protein